MVRGWIAGECGHLISPTAENFNWGPARLQQYLEICRKREIAMHSPAAAQTTTPLTEDAISIISSCVVSQESNVSKSGPAK